jgi:ribose transport system permease protein
MAAFGVAGLLSGIAGVLLAGSLGSVDPSSGGEYLLTPFAAAFLGTVAISVGRFNVLGTLLGLYCLQVGEAGLALLGAPVWISNIFSGGTLLVAIGFAALTQRDGLRVIRDRLHAAAARLTPS